MKKTGFRLENLFSRKFIVSIACLLGGFSLIKSGAFLPGVSAIITSCVAYLVTEGILDVKSVQKICDVYEGKDTEDVTGFSEFDL